MLTLNLTLIMHQSCRTGVVMLIKFSVQKLIFPDATLTTDQTFFFLKMRIMSLHKQLEYNKGLFMYRVLNNQAP